MFLRQTILAAHLNGKPSLKRRPRLIMSREPFEAIPDMMDVEQLAEALQISKTGAHNPF